MKGDLLKVQYVRILVVKIHKLPKIINKIEK